ncbi:MAG TPA: type II toxin-antitoxin system VapC family toxin [Bryobacteraceae bacterium]|nr:type II toxin-antitoxin system VapC family toxin [Bryobacteraceae bacterium]
MTWAAVTPEKLGRRVRRELQRAQNELYLSPVSIWEARYVERSGRLRISQPFSAWIEQMLAEMPLREAPFTVPVGVAAARIELPHADPGDVFLAATASVYDLTLVTADSRLPGCSWLKTLSNT